MFLVNMYNNWFIQNFCFRDNTNFVERIEIKRIYRHPLYKFPQLYNDMVVLELGRRVVFDFDKYGHTPTCLNQEDNDIIGKIATVQVTQIKITES